MRREYWELKWAADAVYKERLILFDPDARLVKAINDVLEIANSPQDVNCATVRRARAAVAPSEAETPERKEP